MSLLRRIVERIGRSIEGFTEDSSYTRYNLGWRASRHPDAQDRETLEGWGRSDRSEDDRAAERGETPPE